MPKRFDLPHTPGPWHVGVGLMVCAEDGSPIARCSATRGKFEYEEPNAYLLAAAPELLAELRIVYERSYNPFEPGNQSEQYKRVGALIAKAEGGAA